MSARTLLILFLLAAPVMARASDTPEAVARGFYTVVLSLKEGGIPDSAGRARLKPFISQALAHTLAAANEAELAYAQNSRHAVPPLLEGDIFVSLFDGASTAKVVSCHSTDKRAACPAALSYRSPSGRTYHWQDTLRLTQTADGWRVDDVVYGGKVPYANRGTLTSNLAFAIRNARGR